MCGHECWVTWRANAEGGSVCYECWVKQWANAEGGIVYGHE